MACQCLAGLFCVPRHSFHWRVAPRLLQEAPSEDKGYAQSAFGIPIRLTKIRPLAVRGNREEMKWKRFTSFRPGVNNLSGERQTVQRHSPGAPFLRG